MGRWTDLATHMVDDITKMKGDDARERGIAVLESYLAGFTTAEEAMALREAVGNAGAMHPELEMDPNDPVGTVRAVVEYVNSTRRVTLRDGSKGTIVGAGPEGSGTMLIHIDGEPTAGYLWGQEIVHEDAHDRAQVYAKGWREVDAILEAGPTEGLQAAAERVVKERGEFEAMTNELRDAATLVLKSGGDWLGDMTEQAAEDPKANAFMSAMEDLQATVEGDKDYLDSVRKLRVEASHWDREQLVEASTLLGCMPGKVVEKLTLLVEDADPKRTGLRELAEEFLGHWTLLPPLVRASIAIGVWEEMERRVSFNGSRAVREKLAGMERRGRVTALHAIGDGHLADFMAALANHADSEAERQGIDSDVRYQTGEGMDPYMALLNRKNERDPSMPKWVSTKDMAEAAESAVIASVRVSVEADIDKEVLDELTKAAKGGDGGEEQE